MARDDMLAARAELSAGRIFEHSPIHGENVERDLGPGEIWHHDNIVDWTAQLLIAHSGEILLGTNAAAFGILKVSHRRDIHQAPKAEPVDAVSRLHTGTRFAFACGPAVAQSDRKSFDKGKRGSVRVGL